MATPEIWKTFPDDTRFTVSSEGRVRFGDKPPKVLKPRMTGRVYVCTSLARKKVQYGVHHMVLTAFVGPRPLGHTASHLNGIPSDNARGNLAWETHSQNCMRKHQHGTAQTGSRNSSAKLTQAAVDHIRSSNLSSQMLAGIYGVSCAHLRRVRRGVAWHG